MIKDKNKAEKRFSDYLTQHNIPYTRAIDNGILQITIAYHGYGNCPGKCIESCIGFYEDDMEARVYYDINGSHLLKISEHKAELMRLFNYINAEVWLCSADGMGGRLYKPHRLFSPRLYMTEDENFDITLTTIINYDIFELAPLETNDYITLSCPVYLNVISTTIFGVIFGMMNFEQAKEHIKSIVADL